MAKQLQAQFFGEYIDLLVFGTAKKARAYGSAAVKIQEKSPYLHVLNSAK